MARAVEVTEVSRNGNTPLTPLTKYIGVKSIINIVEDGTGSIVVTEGKAHNVERVVEEDPATLQAAIDGAETAGVNQVNYDVLNIVGYQEDNFETRPQTFLIDRINEFREDPTDNTRTRILYNEEHRQEMVVYVVDETVANVLADVNA